MSDQTKISDEPFWRKPLPLIARSDASSEAATEVGNAQPIENQGVSLDDIDQGIKSRRDNGPTIPEDEASATSGVSAPPPEEPRLAPHVVLADTVNALDRARFEARTCRADTTEARANFARCLGAWNASGPAPQTQEDLRKEWVASNQRERERKAATGQLARAVTVGQMAKAMAGGNRRAGGSVAYRRGALSKAEALTVTANRLRAAAAAKLPSQR